MLLEDYILYTVENHNNADEQLVQSSTCTAKETSFVEGKFLLTKRNTELGWPVVGDKNPNGFKFGVKLI